MAADNHAHYRRIGFTVILGIFAILATLVYLGGVGNSAHEILVETYYDNSVSGLSVGSDVNFRGVKLGTVKEISFIGMKYDVTGRDESRIYILMALEDEDPESSTGESVPDRVEKLVEMGLRATVTSSGVTGLSHIEFDIRRDAPEPEKISWRPRNLFVPPRNSLFENFSDSLTKVMSQINKMDLAAVWSNVNDTVQSLANAAESAKLAVETGHNDLEKLFGDLTETTAAAKDLVQQLRDNPSLLVRERIAEPLKETERIHE